MNVDETKPRGFGELRQQAEKAVGLSLKDFRKIPTGDTQKLISYLVLGMRELERCAGQLQKAELELKESRKHASELFDLAPVGYFILDSQGIISNINFTAGHMLNTSKAQMVKSPFLDFVEPRHQTAFRSYLKELANTGHLLSNEVEMRKSDGTVFYAQLQAVALRESSNLVYRVFVADITERKRAEKIIKESEDRFRTTLDNMLEGCVIVDFKWRYLYVNDAATRLGRRTKEERLGRTMMEVFPGIEKQDVFVHLQRCMENRIPDHYETEFIFPEGKKAWFEVRAEPVPEGMLILYQDITERKLAEKALTENEQRYRDLADQFHEIIFEADVSGKVTYANKKALVSFNLNTDDLNKGVNIFELVIPEQRNIAAERFKTVISDGDIGAYEYTLLRRDGTTFPSLVHTARIMREGQTQGIRGIAIDISKKKQSQQI